MGQFESFEQHSYGDDVYDERSSDPLLEKAKQEALRKQNEERGGKIVEASDQEVASSPSHDGETFEVGEGLTKEAEFKRLTGEDWPGTTYYAESNGADGFDDGVLETWTIRKRQAEGASGSKPAEKPNEGANENSGGSQPSEADLAYQRWLEQNESRTEQEFNNDFSGETNRVRKAGKRKIGVKSWTDGKERTFEGRDLYTPIKSDNPGEFDRAKGRHKAERGYEKNEEEIDGIRKQYYNGEISQEDFRRLTTAIAKGEQPEARAEEPEPEAPEAEAQPSQEEALVQSPQEESLVPVPSSREEISSTDLSDPYAQVTYGRRPAPEVSSDANDQFALPPAPHEGESRIDEVLEADEISDRPSDANIALRNEGQMVENREPIITEFVDDDEEEQEDETTGSGERDESGETDTEESRETDAEESREADAEEASEADAEEASEADAEEASEADAEEAREAEEEEAREEEQEDRAVDEEITLRIERIRHQFDDQKEARRRALEKALGDLRPELAELYARNRRLFIGSKNKADYERTRQEYSRMLDEYLKLQAEKIYDEERSREIDPRDEERAKSDVRSKLDEFKANNPNATREQIEAEKSRLEEEASRRLLDFDGVKSRTNCRFLREYLRQQNALETETVDALDGKNGKGTVWRRLVSGVIDNKKVKVALGVIGAAGLIATGVGVAAGGLAIATSWTAGGIALGAGRGALSGAIMSRQSAERSAVKGFATEEEMRQRIGEIAISENGNVDISNVAGFLMDRYNEAKNTDLSNNRKRTAISAGIGAIIGGVMSGVHVEQTVTTTKPAEYEEGIIGRQEDIVEYRPKTDFESISHAKGTGIEKLYHEMGGTGDFNQNGAKELYREIGESYGLKWGKSGWSYPGEVGKWDSLSSTATTAKAVAREFFERAVKEGFIPAERIVTPGEPIYGMVQTAAEEIMTEQVRHRVFEPIVQASATVLGGVVGAGIGNLFGRRSTGNSAEAEPSSRTTGRQAPSRTPDADLFMDDTPDFGPSSRRPASGATATSGARSGSESPRRSVEAPAAPSARSGERPASVEAPAATGTPEAPRRAETVDAPASPEARTPDSEQEADIPLETVNQMRDRIIQLTTGPFGNMPENGIDFMIRNSSQPFDEYERNQAEQIWNGLNGREQRIMTRILEGLANDENGRIATSAFRDWLAHRGDNPATAPEATGAPAGEPATSEAGVNPNQTQATEGTTAPETANTFDNSLATLVSEQNFGENQGLLSTNLSEGNNDDYRDRVSAFMGSLNDTQRQAIFGFFNGQPESAKNNNAFYAALKNSDYATNLS